MRILGALIVAFGLLNACAESFTVDGVNFHYRKPSRITADSRIMVLFGGRNWDGGKTLKTYQFDELADKHHLFLISPSFKDRDYWEPGKWSGGALKKAVAKLENQYHLKPGKLFFYGYSAGAQCANLFYAWMPERVAAWGAHACGVYFTVAVENSPPALITCGINDDERWRISRTFVSHYRESGGELLWKYYPGGHELNPEALELARTWFDAILSGETTKEYGEDDTMRTGRNFDSEFRNPLYNAKIRELWLK